MKVQIRQAIKSDAAAILALIQELAVFEKEPDAVVVKEEDIKAHGFGVNPLFQCLVAESDGQVVGMALFTRAIRLGKAPLYT